MQTFSTLAPELKAIWESALSQEKFRWPFFLYAWHAHWFMYFGEKEKLTIMANPGGSVILPLSIMDGIAHFSGGVEIADYLDAIGAEEKKVAVWESALPILKKQGATNLVLRNVPDGSPTLDFFRSLPQTEIIQEDTTPILPLPATFDEYLGALDRKDRHELKRKMKKFEAEHGELAFSVRENTHIQTDSLIHLMQHDPDKVAFLTPAMIKFFEGLPAILPDTLHQFVLTAGEKIIASTLAFQTPDALLLYNSGFDPQYPGSGWYIKVKTIAWAIDKKLPSYNFLQGSERYKYDLGGLDHAVYKITLPL